MNKRLLALIVAVIFIIGSVATGFAATFEDVVDTDFEDEVNRLVALEIISGYPDGTFRPEGLVTRAEFAKITVTATGVGAAAEYAKGATKFTDVEAEHWAAGYINVATDLGIIQGYGDGRFGPEDQVTYAEAITMIVRSLGYEPAAQAKGGYPGGYLAVAAENDITDGITVLANVAANRGDIAVMVDNSLEVDMMVQDGFGDRPTWKVEKGETLLSKLGVDEVEGKVVEIARVNDKLDDDEIVVEWIEDKETVTKTYKLVSKDTPEALFGLGVKLLVKNKKVVHAEVDTDAKDIFVDTVEGGEDKNIALKVADKEYDWLKDEDEDEDDKLDAKVRIYVNFEDVVDTDFEEFDIFYGTVILEGRYAVFANLFGFNYDDAGLVVDVAKDEIEFAVLGSGDEDVLLLDEYDNVYVYNKDFTAANVDDIDEGSLIYTWEEDDELFVVVVEDTVKGEVTRARKDEVRVGGKYYDIAESAILSEDKGKNFKDNFNGDDLVDEDVVLYLDLNGDVAAVVTEADITSDTLYGIATWFAAGRRPVLTVFTQEGKEVDYHFDDYNDVDNIANMDGVKDKFDKDGSPLWKYIKYELNSDGEIVKLELVGDDDDDDAKAVVTKEADKKYFEHGEEEDNRYYLTKDTVIMWAVDDEGDFDPTIVEYEDLVKIKVEKVDGEAVKAVLVEGKGKNANFVVFVDKNFKGVKDDTYFGVVTGKPVKEGKDWYAEIDVFGEGKDEYKVDKGLKKGKLFAFNLDGKDKVKEDKDAEIVTGKVYEIADSFITLIESDDEGDKTYKVLTGAVLYKVDTDGDLDGTIRVNRIKTVEKDEEAHYIVLLLEDGEVKAALVAEQKDHLKGLYRVKED